MLPTGRAQALRDLHSEDCGAMANNSSATAPNGSTNRHIRHTASPTEDHRSAVISEIVKGMTLHEPNGVRLQQGASLHRVRSFAWHALFAAHALC
jgi:hypothetical protein